MEGSSLACKYQKRVEVNGSGKHSSLLPCGNNHGCKEFYSKGSRGLKQTKRQIYYACRISVTRISAPKRLAIVANTQKIVQYKLKHLFGAKACVAEIRQILRDIWGSELISILKCCSFYPTQLGSITHLIPAPIPGSS